MTIRLLYILLFWNLSAYSCTKLLVSFADVTKLTTHNTNKKTVDVYPLPELDSYLLERTGDQWFSSHMDEGRVDAPQGNPLWAIFIPGKEVAEFVGIKMLVDDKLMRVPTAYKYNGKLAKINTRLADEDKCLITFYHPMQKLSDYEYLNYHRHLQMPIEPKGTTLIHDFTYHVWSANYYPNDVTLLSAAQSDVIVKFSDFVDTYVKTMSPRENRVKDFYLAVKKKLLHKQVNAVDVGTAGITNTIGVPAKKQTIKEAYEYYVKSGRSPRSAFIMMTGDLKFQILEKATKNKLSEKDKISLRSHYNTLIMNFYKSIGGIEAISDVSNVNYSEAELCDKISEKRAKIQAAVQGL